MSREDKIAEDAPFEVPPFDEKEFIRKELISFKTTLILFAFSVAVAGLSYAIWWNDGKDTKNVGFMIHILIAMALGALLFRVLFKLAKVDISHWKRKEWFGTFALYFFFWLGFFLLFTNPPLTDAAAPRIEADVSPHIQAAGQPVQFGAYIADNVGLDLGTLTFCVHPYTGPAAPAYANLSGNERSACKRTWTRSGGDPFWNHTESFAAGKYGWYVRIGDGAGQVAEKTGTVEVGSPLVGKPALPRDSKFVSLDDRLSVRIKPELMENVRVVQFTIDANATWHNMKPHPEEEKAKQGFWTTDPSYKGWSIGEKKVGFRVVEQPTFFRGIDWFVRGSVVDPSGPYNVTVGEIPGVEIGSTVASEVNERRFVHPGQTPGFELPLVLLATVGLAVVGRRRHA